MSTLVRALFALLLAALALPPAAPRAQDAEPLTVFAAASLTDAMEELSRRYREQTGAAVRFSFASSSTLARQVEAGAPAQIYASANQRWMDYLAERGLIEAETRTTPIANRLVLVAPADSPVGELDLDPSLDLPALLGPDGFLAVGDPEHVPAGIYARQALESFGWWPALEPRLARADDVRAALALVERGEAPLGIVYATDARIAEGLRVVGSFPGGSHDAIDYPFAVLAGERSAAVDALFEFLTGAEALGVFESFGFARNEAAWPRS